MSVPPSQGFLQGLRNTRQAQGDGTLQGRVRSAMPASARPVGGRQEAMSRSVGPSVRVDTLTLKANSQPIATTVDDIVWHNELVGLTPREGFGGYGTTPTDTIVVPADGRLLTTLTLKRSTATAWTIRWHVTRRADTLTYDMAAGSSTDPAIAEAPPLTVQAGDVLRVRILQSSAGSETLDSATLHMTLLNVSPRTEPPGCAIVGTATVAFTSPGTAPADLAWDGTHLWNADNDAHIIYRLNPATGAVVQSFAAPGPTGPDGPLGLAWDGTHLWTTNANEVPHRIYRLNPADGTVDRSFASPGDQPTGLAWDGTHLWNADTTSTPDKMIYRLNPADGTVDRSIVAPNLTPFGLAWDGTHLWNADASVGSKMIYRLNPADGTVLQSFAAPGTLPWGLAWDTAHGCRVWHCDPAADSIYTIE